MLLQQDCSNKINLILIEQVISGEKWMKNCISPLCEEIILYYILHVCHYRGQEHKCFLKMLFNNHVFHLL